MNPPDGTDRGVLRLLTGNPEPSPVDRDAAWARLTAEIEAAARPVRQPRRRLVVAAAAVVIAALVAVAVMVRPGGPTPAEAALGELARATRALAPEDLPVGSYTYSLTESVQLTGGAVSPDGPVIAYLLPVTTEAWWRGDTARIATSVGTPVFFDPALESAYYAAGLDAEDRVGTTTTDVVTGVTNRLDPADWSTDPETLRLQLEREVAVPAATGAPVEPMLLELVEGLLAPDLRAPPALRAALLDVVASLPVDVLADRNTVVVTLDGTDEALGRTRASLTFDARGHLLESVLVAVDGVPDAGIPAGTAVERLVQGPPAIVAAPGLRP